jgi:uncharacterized protein (DUF952 family)
MIYHLAFASDWAAAQETGEYAISTRGVTLAEQGYIHAGTEEQVPGVYARYYADATDLVLVAIDESRLTVPLRYDDVPGSPTPYPHIYGPLPVGAVVDVTPYP